MNPLPSMNSTAEFTPSFRAALMKRERRPLARVTYCDLNWVPQEVVTGEVADGSFSMDDSGRRQAPITLQNNTGLRTPDPASSLWFGRFLLEWGLRTSAGDEFVNLGKFVATSQSARVTPSAGWASLGLEDPSALWGTFSNYWIIGANTLIRDAITAIALDAGEVASNLNLYPTAEIVGADMTGHPGDSRWDLASRIAAAAAEAGQVLKLTYGGGIGRCLLYPEVDPATATASSWTFSLGDGITLGLDKRWEQRDFANRIQVYGGSGKSATIFSEIADTSTGPYGIGRRGDWCYKWPQGAELDPLITTQARADARRNYLYWLKRTSQESLEVQGLVIPGLSLSDVITVRETAVTKTDANYTLTGGYSFGLASGGTMRLGVRRVVLA